MNYDDVFIEAFKKANQDFDLLYFKSTENFQNKFCHIRYDKSESEAKKASSKMIDTPNNYEGLEVYKRPIIININGMIIRNNLSDSAFTITEDRHMTINKLEKLIPTEVLAELSNSNFLFMGVCFKDWCIRNFFLNVWQRPISKNVSWAVQESMDPLEKEFWNKYGVNPIDISLKEYLAELNSKLEKQFAEGSRL